MMTHDDEHEHEHDDTYTTYTDVAATHADTYTYDESVSGDDDTYRDTFTGTYTHHDDDDAFCIVSLLCCCCDAVCVVSTYACAYVSCTSSSCVC